MAVSRKLSPKPARHAFANTLKSFKTASGKEGQFYSLPALAKQYPQIQRLPVSIRIVLESVLRNCDGRKVTAEHVQQLAHWAPNAARTDEIPFVVSRVVLQDFTGVPLLADLAAMRSVAVKLGKNPKKIEPLVPVDLVVDHSIMVDHYGKKNSLDLNMKLEFQRNRERYEFMKWGMQAFDTFGVVPPGFGIVHQVNLEYLARGVHKRKDNVYYPDTRVGTDSHTPHVDALGVIAIGVGGLEAENVMLGRASMMRLPEIVGVQLTGQRQDGITATDVVLALTEFLRKAKVVGAYLEFFGEGAAKLTIGDRATISNMAPEYGATAALFSIDEQTLEYLTLTGREAEQVKLVATYAKAAGLWSDTLKDAVYARNLVFDLSSVVRNLAGPSNPHARVATSDLAAQGIAGPWAMPAPQDGTMPDGAVVIAAITSCTNTSNPGVLLAAGLLGLALAPSLPLFLLAWIIIGLGMGTGLYDPAFSTLGHIYGRGARPYITSLTLFGGFASTACWPSSG